MFAQRGRGFGKKQKRTIFLGDGEWCSPKTMVCFSIKNTYINVPVTLKIHKLVWEKKDIRRGEGVTKMNKNKQGEGGYLLFE